LAAIFFFSFHIVSFFSHRDLLLSAVAASLHYLPQMSAFNIHMQHNAYCRNLSEPLLPCYGNIYRQMKLSLQECKN